MGNGGGVDFGVSQCFPLDLDTAADADAAAAARCVHSLNVPMNPGLRLINCFIVAFYWWLVKIKKSSCWLFFAFCPKSLVGGMDQQMVLCQSMNTVCVV